MTETPEQLLLSLKTVVEGLLSSQVFHVWNIYGGLTRLHSVLERIMKHEFTVFKENGEEDVMVFIRGLADHDLTYSGQADPAMAWLQECLENHWMSGKLSQLVSNESLVSNCYSSKAFLRRPQYVEAAVTCLRAVELNQLTLLTDIHPSLYVRNVRRSEEKLHRRCSSYPEGVAGRVTTGRRRMGPRLWRSTPCLSAAHQPQFSSNTEPSSPARARRPLPPGLLTIDYRAPRRTPPSPLSAPSAPARSKSFLEGPTVVPMSTGFFPRPALGQSLSSFLSSSQFSYANAELDRENAHFSISEAIIAAIEQVKCNRWEQLMEEAAEESDEEICELKERIRERRRLRQADRPCLSTIPLSSDSRTDTTDASLSPLSEQSPSHSSDSVSTDCPDDHHSVQLAFSSPPKEEVASEEVEKRADDESRSVDVSAEGVALSLLRRFSDKHLPRASDIDWLVSEKDAPQKLLPLPDSWPVECEAEPTTALRGTEQWAPPRPQIIFTIHPPPVRRVVMERQKEMCAGCGMRVAPEYAHRFRYCDYLGRYFCTGCHSDQQALIPARILTKWDFNKFPVSNFSYKLLEQMSLDPLFNVGDINPALYKKVRALDRVRNLRLQLFYIKDFLLNCRFCSELKTRLEREPRYLLSNTEEYSVQDFVGVRSGQLVSKLNSLVTQATGHISNCQLCQARGFVCERCLSGDIIFPWQVNKVCRCNSCGACYHIACRAKAPSVCTRCDRISARLSAPS